MQIQLGMNINKKLVDYYANQTNTVTSSGTDPVTIQPPSGYMGEINGIGVNIPAVPGAGSGTHSITIYTAGLTGYNPILTVSAAYNVGIKIQGLSVISGTPVPASDTSIATVLKGLHFSNTSYLVIIYYNGTNVSQTGARSHTVEYLETAETTF